MTSSSAQGYGDPRNRRVSERSVQDSNSSAIDAKGPTLMFIDFTAAHCWRRRLGLAAAAVLAAGGLLLPVGGSAVAQVDECPTSPIGARAPSQVSAADRATILQLHNQYRHEVGVPPLAWDDSLAEAAQGWADITAPLGKLCHDPNRPNQGESLAYHQSVTDGVKLWYEEKHLYDSNPEPVNLQTGNWRPWGHYSQMVWSSTQRVGCGQDAFAQHPGFVLLDCRYSPPGNVDGQYPYPPQDTPPKDIPPKATASSGQALALVNQERTKAGCASLQVVSKLQNPAEQQSRDQAARDRSGGDGADGSTTNSRLSGLGYSRWGENVAWFQGDQAQSAQAAVNSWSASGGRANMLNCAFKETGLAVASSNSGKSYWTQTFGG